MQSFRKTDSTVVVKWIGFTADNIMVKVRLDDCYDRAKGISRQKMMEEFMSSSVHKIVGSR